jgi:hypothetical protein
VAGYHCNHNRTRTVYHGPRKDNDLNRFFYSVSEPGVPEQAESWGLAGETLHEVPIRAGIATDWASALIDVLPDGPRVPSNAVESSLALTYDSGHILPYVADALVLSPPGTTVAYLGENTALETMLSAVLDRAEHPLVSARLDDAAAIAELPRVADLLVVDLGLETSESKPEFVELVHVAIDRLVAVERARVEQGHEATNMVLVNSSAAFWEQVVVAQFDCSYTTVHSRVRRATVKRAGDPGIPTGEARDQALRLLRWNARRASEAGRLVLHSGEFLRTAHLDDYHAFGEGWANPDASGIWTEGRRADLLLALPGADGSQVVTLGVGMACAGPKQPVHVTLLAGDRPVVSREFSADFGGVAWRVEAPAANASGEVDLTLLIDEPHSPRALGWSLDPRPLGILVQSVMLGQPERRVHLWDTVRFAEGAGSEHFLIEGWGSPEAAGVWSVAPRCSLALELEGAAEGDAEAVLDVEAFVPAEHPKLTAEAWIGDQRLATRAFRHGDSEHALIVPLPSVPPGTLTTIELRIHDPARPQDLDLGLDRRLLGLRLSSLTVRRPTAAQPETEPSPERLGRLRRRVRALRS